MYNTLMKKSLSFGTAIMFLLLCSCTTAQNTATEIYFDTAVTITAECSSEVLNGAFSLCKDSENKLSRTKKDSEISLLSESVGEISPDTLEVIKKGLYYCDYSDGRFDITLAPLSDIWDFKEEIIPSRDEIAEALKNIDYQSIEVSEDNEVNTNGKSIDLGGIAKGYIADKLLIYFTEQGVKNAIINLGGNVTVLGNDFYNIGIKKPFSTSDICATIRMKNKSVSTSGVYERCFKKDGVLYHHILDIKTGYPADTDLLSASVIGNSSTDCDALSTICVLYGLRGAKSIIEDTDGFEAVFIDKDYNLSVTSGLKIKDGVITLTER